jgi:hypothetical protein
MLNITSCCRSTKKCTPDLCIWLKRHLVYKLERIRILEDTSTAELRNCASVLLHHGTGSKHSMREVNFFASFSYYLLPHEHMH